MQFRPRVEGDKEEKRKPLKGWGCGLGQRLALGLSPSTAKEKVSKSKTEGRVRVRCQVLGSARARLAAPVCPGGPRRLACPAREGCAGLRLCRCPSGAAQRECARAPSGSLGRGGPARRCTPGRRGAWKCPSLGSENENAFESPASGPLETGGAEPRGGTAGGRREAAARGCRKPVRGASCLSRRTYPAAPSPGPAPRYCSAPGASRLCTCR